jgi:uncharacterized membrane protein
MQSVIDYLKSWQPHPFVDHFTVALILLAIVTDLVASIFSSRLWLRYMALTLMIAGAIGAAGSNVTGGWEAGRVWDLVSGPGKAVLERHARLGDILPWVFAGIALWRLGLQFVGFLLMTRPLYLLVAFLSGVAIIYQGHLGAVMVYDYGIGTASLAGNQPPVSSPVPSPAVHVPETMSTPSPESSVAPVPSIAPTAAPSSTLSMPPTAMPTASVPATPTSASPSPGPSTSSSGSPAETPSPASSAARNL